MNKIRLTAVFKERLCCELLQQIKNGNNTFYKLKKILPEIDSRFGDRELRSALRFGCNEWLTHGLKNKYKLYLTGKTYSYKVV